MKLYRKADYFNYTGTEDESMKKCFWTELKKAFGNKRFWIAVFVGTAISLLSARSVLDRYFEEMEFRQWQIQNSPEDYMNSDYPVYTVYNRWIGGNFGQVERDIFFLLLPILAILAYAWSYHEEKKSGYIRNVVCRTGRKAYFFSKYASAFAAGFTAILIPMICNLMVISAFMSAARPDVYYDIYNGIMTDNMGFQMFYEKPFLFLIVRIVMDCTVGGLSAACVVALTFFMRNKFALILAPFLGLLTIQYAASLWYYYVSEISISPLEFIKAGSRPSSVWIAVGYAAVTFFLSFGITMWKGVRDDVF